MKKKKKKKNTTSSIMDELLPRSIGKAYKEFKKQQEINELKRVKLEEREETKRLVQERKECLVV